MAIFFLYPLILSMAGYSPLMVGFAWIVFEIALIAGRPWSNTFISRYGTRIGLISGALMMVSGISILAFMPPVYLIIAGRLLQGAGWGLFILSNNIHNAKILPTAIMGFGFGLAGLAPIIPQFVFFPLAEWMILSGYIHLTLVIALAACLIASLFANRLSKQKKTEAGRTPLAHTLKIAWKNKRIRAILLSASAFAMLSAPVLPYMANGAREWGSWGSAFLIPSSGISAFIRLFVSRVVDRRGPGLLAPGFYCATAGLLVACWGKTTVLLTVGGCMFGMGTGILYPVLFSQMSVLAPKDLVTPMFTLFNSFLDAVWVFAPLAAAGLAQIRGYGFMLQIISILIFCCIAYLAVAVWPSIRDQDRKL
jgi:MFS family permease